MKPRAVPDDDHRTLRSAEQGESLVERFGWRSDLSLGEPSLGATGFLGLSCRLYLNFVRKDEMRDTPIQDRTLERQVHELGMTARREHGLAPLRDSTEGTASVEMAPRPSDGHHCGNGDVVLENFRRGTGRAAASIQDDVIGADIEREIEIVLDVLSRQLEAYGNAAGRLADLFGNALEVFDARKIWKPRRADRGSPGVRPRTAAIFSETFLPGRCPPVPVLAPWPPLK